ncbi:MAG: MarR family winged helix-turn-helix transcriptional regulator [Pseudomonadota bacterium]
MASKTKSNPDCNPLIDGLTCPMVEFYRAEGYKPDESVAYLMRRIISVASLHIERELEPTGLTNAQWVPLLKLYMGHASTVAELARVCELDAGSMTRLLDRLEAKQLCRRVRSSDDRRVVNLELTEAGRTAAKGIPEILCRVQNSHLSGFSAEEWQVLKGYLRRILDTAQSLNVSPEKPAEKPSLLHSPTSAAENEKQA